MKLIPTKRKDRKHPTSYKLILGSKEARTAGLIDANGELCEVKKDILPGMIIVRKEA